MSQTHDKTAVWDALHDGTITSMEIQSDGSLAVGVEIQYLGELLEPQAGGFILRLNGFRGLEFRWFKQDQAEPTTYRDPADVARVEPGILDANPIPGGVQINCNVALPGVQHTDYAQLDLEYDDVMVSVDDGRAFSATGILELAARYWSQA